MTRTSSQTDINYFEVIGHAPTVQQLLTGAFLYSRHGYRMKLLNPYSTPPADISDSEPLVHVPFFVQQGEWREAEFVVEYTLQTHYVSGIYRGEGSVLTM